MVRCGRGRGCRARCCRTWRHAATHRRRRPRPRRAAEWGNVWVGKLRPTTRRSPAELGAGGAPAAHLLGARSRWPAPRTRRWLPRPRRLVLPPRGGSILVYAKLRRARLRRSHPTDAPLPGQALGQPPWGSSGTHPAGRGTTALVRGRRGRGAVPRACSRRTRSGVRLRAAPPLCAAREQAAVLRPPRRWRTSADDRLETAWRGVLDERGRRVGAVAGGCWWRWRWQEHHDGRGNADAATAVWSTTVRRQRTHA